MPLVRLDAESLYDSMLFVAGRLNETQYGPADAVQARRDGLVTPNGTARGWRRLVYVQQLRKQMPTHLDNFDFPQMNPNCVERRDSTVAPQALYMMNNAMIDQLAEGFASRVRRAAGDDSPAQVGTAHLLAFCRPPTEAEKQLGITALERLASQWMAAGADPESARQEALTTYCHALMNSAAFLYVD
jgi:hypothetical protein